MVADHGIPVGPESDLHATISSVLLEAAGDQDEPSFIPDVTIRHPDNAVLLWHADAPLSLRAPDSYVKVDLPWILRGQPTGLLHFKLKDGPLTLCRFAGNSDGYRLGCGQGHTVDGRIHKSSTPGWRSTIGRPGSASSYTDHTFTTVPAATDTRPMY